MFWAHQLIVAIKIYLCCWTCQKEPGRMQRGIGSYEGWEKSFQAIFGCRKPKSVALCRKRWSEVSARRDCVKKFWKIGECAFQYWCLIRWSRFPGSSWPPIVVRKKLWNLSFCCEALSLLGLSRWRSRELGSEGSNRDPYSVVTRRYVDICKQNHNTLIWDERTISGVKLCKKAQDRDVATVFLKLTKSSYCVKSLSLCMRICNINRTSFYQINLFLDRRRHKTFFSHLSHFMLSTPDRLPWLSGKRVKVAWCFDF